MYTPVEEGEVMEKQLPEAIAAHLKELVSGDEEALRRLEDLWMEKIRIFEEQIRLLGMDFVESVDADDERGMILTTYSGSLMALGPGFSRHFEYASIKVRSDVPNIVRGENASLSGGVTVGDKASFSDCPVKHTSAVYRIAVVPADVALEEQEQRVREAMVFLTNSFVHLNRHFTYPGTDVPGGFDKKSMVRYLADAHGLTQKTVKSLLDDYSVLLETGMLMGKSVPIGQIGKIGLSLKPPRKARVGRNPATGEEVTIPAKDAHMAPAFKFSRRAKERAAGLPVSRDEGSSG
jgi:nucleoid DNA-binding protein